MPRQKLGLAKSLLNSCQPKSNLPRSCVTPRPPFIALWFGILFVMVSARGHGQEAVRMSQAGAQAAAALRTTNDINYYNVQAGPVHLWFQGEMGIELNDNANYSKFDPDADLILRPDLNARASWAVTEQNTLALSAGVGYAEYLHDRALSGLRVKSDSSAGFNVYSGDFVFNLHDRFSAVDYQIQDPAVSASVIRLENTSGLETTWDLYKLALTAGYDYDLFDSLTAFYRYSDNSSQLFNATAAFITSPTSKAGLQAGAGFTTYGRRVLEDDSHFSVGPFYKARFTPHLSAEVSAGTACYQFDEDGIRAGLNGFTGLYGLAAVNHELNEFFSQSVTFGRTIQRGITADLSEFFSVNYNAKWNFVQNGFAAIRFYFGQGATAGAAEAAGFVAEKYDIYGPGLTLGWRFSKKLAGSLSYDYLQKNSDVMLYSFAQDRLLVDFAYAF
jgi:hypothetical protein